MSGDVKELTAQFKWRKGDVGIIADLNSGSVPEVVVYSRDDNGKEFCYTVARMKYDEHESDYDLETVGRRFTEALTEHHIPYVTFIEAVNSGMKILDEFAKMKELLEQ